MSKLKGYEEIVITEKEMVSSEYALADFQFKVVMLANNLGLQNRIIVGANTEMSPISRDLTFRIHWRKKYNWFDKLLIWILK